MSWVDLMRNAQADLIQIEYGFAADGTIDYLKFWASISRGHRLLAVEYWASRSDSHERGRSLLEWIRIGCPESRSSNCDPAPNRFLLPVDLGTQGLLQIAISARSEKAVASAPTNETLHHFGSLAEQLVPA